MAREKTNSMVHLVKIIVNEVIDERIKSGDLMDLQSIGDHWCEKLSSTLEKTGRAWTREESALLINEVKTAIAQIAKNHHRSVIAIRCRIQDHKLLDFCR